MSLSSLRGQPRALLVYALIGFVSSFALALVFTVNVIYHVTVVRLDPLQLVLIGTILEGTIFLFEIPTGILADVRSRRISVIIGYLLMGVGFLVEGSVPTFAGVAGAQVLWGLGYTFTSGASEAWVADEIGPERAGGAYLRSAQAGTVGGMAAIPVSAAIGQARLTLPILMGGGLLIVLGLALVALMREEGYRPTPREDRTAWGSVRQTLAEARGAIRRQPAIRTLLAIGLFYGLYSEGYDRLWNAHILQDMAIPVSGALQPVIWFGIIRWVGSAIDLLAVEVVRRRVDTTRPGAIGRGLMLAAAGIVVALAAFGFNRSFWLALPLVWVIGALRSVTGPLLSAWLNRQVDDPQVRATVFSASSQVDAIGQVAGGPLVGVIGRTLSVSAALVSSAALLAPVLALYRRAMRRG